jgi:DNA polymerase III subunit delta
MAERSYEQILARLKKKEYDPVYFLTGEEPYYIDLVSDYIEENVLTEADKSFNLTILYGKETDANAVMNAAKRFPMMASQQVVIVKEAQEIAKFDDLIHYIEKPLNSTLLVLNYKYSKPDKRKKVFKSLINNSIFLESKRLYDNQVQAWITGYLSARNLSIEPKASALLTEFLGNDLSKISNEIDKLIISLGEGQKMITSSLIERNIGISKDFNIFELQRALGKRDVVAANRIINYFAENPKNHSAVGTISMLYGFFSKVLIYYWIKDKSQQNLFEQLGVKHQYFLKDYIEAARNYDANKAVKIIELLREYDLKSKGYKGTDIPDGDLLKELIFKILH